MTDAEQQAQADGAELRRTVREVFGYVPTDWAGPEVRDHSSTWPAWLSWYQRVEKPLAKSLLEQFAASGEKRLPPLFAMRNRYKDAAKIGRPAAGNDGPHCSHCGIQTERDGQAPTWHYSGVVPVVCDGAKGYAPVTAEYRLGPRSVPVLLWTRCRCQRGQQWFRTVGPATEAQWAARSRDGAAADALLRDCWEAVRAARLAEPHVDNMFGVPPARPEDRAGTARPGPKSIADAVDRMLPPPELEPWDAAEWA